MIGSMLFKISCKYMKPEIFLRYAGTCVNVSKNIIKKINIVR